MTAREIFRRIRELKGNDHVRQNGAHVRVACACGKNRSTVPDHRGEDVKPGTCRGIEKDLEPCFGKGWLLG